MIQFGTGVINDDFDPGEPFYRCSSCDGYYYGMPHTAWYPGESIVWLADGEVAFRSNKLEDLDLMEIRYCGNEDDSPCWELADADPSQFTQTNGNRMTVLKCTECDERWTYDQHTAGGDDYIDGTYATMDDAMDQAHEHDRLAHLDSNVQQEEPKDLTELKRSFG